MGAKIEIILEVRPHAPKTVELNFKGKYSAVTKKH